MATKLKNFKYSFAAKIAAFLLAIIFLCASMAELLYVNDTLRIPVESVYKLDYLKSEDFRYKLNEITSQLDEIIRNYKSEEYIKSGKIIDNYGINPITYFDYSPDLKTLYEDYKTSYYSANPGKNFDAYPEKTLLNNFEKEYSKEITYYNKQFIAESLVNYKAILRNLNSMNGVSYYISSNYGTVSNLENPQKSYFTAKKVYLIYEPQHFEISKNLDTSNMYAYSSNALNEANDKIYVGIDESFVTPLIKTWNAERVIWVNALEVLALCLSGFIICLIYLGFSAGRRENGLELYLGILDRIYLDIYFLMTIGIASLCMNTFAHYLYDFKYASFIPLIAVSSAVGLGFYISIIKHVKNHSLLKHTLVYTLITALFSFFIKLVSNLPLSLRMLPTPSKAQNLSAIIKGTKEISSGNLEHHIQHTGTNIYSELAADINGIADGLKAAVKNELKSERLKSELISNVSHDIRTPLTSIITYVDLLKKEGLDSKDAEKYLDILDQKSKRLKILTDDLFEASKASCGDIPVNLDRLDIASLLSQVVGELDEKITASGLNFKFNLPEEKLFVKADGKLLWRIVDNLMNNIFKYALKNSRVYVDLYALENKVYLTFKNISSYELNIEANELLERFKRADESRNSDGSGLGLSIARSLAALQNGSLNIDIDGDLFKATVALEKYIE